MGLPKILKIAKEVLMENTGLKFPRLVNISIQEGFYHVIMDMFDGSASAGDAARRTYDVKIDESGKLRGYSSISKSSVTQAGDGV